MKILMIHSKNMEFSKKAIATSHPQEFDKDKIKLEGLILAAFVSVEDQDTYDVNIIAHQGAQVIMDAIGQIEEFPSKIKEQNEDIKEYNRKIEEGKISGNKKQKKELILDENLYKVEKVVVYPWAHLSKFLSNDSNASKVCPKIADILRESNVEAIHSPFGWYKSFKINCLGHEIAEMYRVVNLYIQPEEHVENAAFKIITSDGKILDLNYNKDGSIDYPQEISSDDLSDFRDFLDAEASKKEKADLGIEPAHIKIMHDFQLLGYDPNADAGNFRWYPKGLIIKELIRKHIEDRVIDFGALPVDTPIMYNVKSKKLIAQTARFPARTYWLISGNERFLLRFAGDFLQFDMLSQMNLTTDDLPFRLYEFEQYDFRREQKGELSGLRRLRAFLMPDFHTLCKDLEAGINEFKLQYDLDKKLLTEYNLDSYLIFRTTQDFFKDNKDWIIRLIKDEKKPALIELWEDRYYYFILKFERAVLSATGESATLATIQIDIENSLEYITQNGVKREKYDIKVKDDEGNYIHPIILHNAPAGGVERILWGILESAERNKDTLIPGIKTWLSPIQVRILPISENQIEYAESIMKELNKKGFRVDLDDRNEKLGKKIRTAETHWIPYIIIVGDKEKENHTVSIRKRLINQPYRPKKRTFKSTQNVKIEKLIEILEEDTEGFPKYKLPKPYRRVSTKIDFR
ncbi:MAG: threonine--tRNA ligase [Candidatus Lokiarchaeota archaeon]|nr:threonine--tRNA ligase [Candidatus Lokiarchaeota archaeon]